MTYMTKLITPTGLNNTPRNSRDVATADYLIDLKKRSQSNPWPVIDEVIKVFRSKAPRKWDAEIITIEVTRKAQDNKYAVKEHASGTLRHTVDIPVFVHHAIRCLYNSEELPFDKKFYKEFWKRYPVFRVIEKT